MGVPHHKENKGVLDNLKTCQQTVGANLDQVGMEVNKKNNMTLMPPAHTHIVIESDR